MGEYIYILCLYSMETINEKKKKKSHLERSFLHVVILRAVKEGRNESVDGVPHHRKVVALSPDALQRVPAGKKTPHQKKTRKPAVDRFVSSVSGKCTVVETLINR